MAGLDSPLTALDMGPTAAPTPPRPPLFSTPLSELTQSDSGLLTLDALIKEALGDERYDALMNFLTPEEKEKLGIFVPMAPLVGGRSRRRRRSKRSKSMKRGRR